MYLGKLKTTGSFTRKDILDGQLLTGQMEVMWYLKLARVATPRLIKIATGYSIKTINQKCLYPLADQFKLVKKIKVKTLDESETEISTNLYGLSLRGYKKLGIKVDRRLGWEDLLGGWPISEHRRLVSEILAYFFRNSLLRKKGERADYVGDEDDWRYILRGIGEREKKRLEKEYGTESEYAKLQIKDLASKIRKAPIPDVWCIFNCNWFRLGLIRNMGLKETDNTVLFIEVETGKDRKSTHLDEKLKRYQQYRSFFKEYLGMNNFGILFIAPNEEKEKALQARLDKAPFYPSVSYPVFVMNKSLISEMLCYNKHIKEVKHGKSRKNQGTGE